MSDPPGETDLGDSLEALDQAWRSRILVALPEADLAAVRQALTFGRPFGVAS